MRRGLDPYRRIISMLNGQLTHAARGGRGGLSITLRRSNPVVHASREDEADPQGVCCLDDSLGIVVAIILQVEEIHARRNPVEKHFGEGERRAECDRLPVNPLREWVEHAVPPAEKAQVIT
jgi:hypothetical protein